MISNSMFGCFSVIESCSPAELLCDGESRGRERKRAKTSSDADVEDRRRAEGFVRPIVMEEWARDERSVP